jgi:hypothetical protein
MPFGLVKMNPALVPYRDQGLKLFTAAVAGPALLYAGYKYPGSLQSKIALMGVGGLLVYTNLALFQEALGGKKEVQEEGP